MGQIAFVSGYGCSRERPHYECGHVAELQRLAGPVTEILISLLDSVYIGDYAKVMSRYINSVCISSENAITLQDIEMKLRLTEAILVEINAFSRSLSPCLYRTSEWS